MLLFVFMSLILLFLSGMSWPVAAEPTFWRYVSYVFPSTFGMHGYVKLMGTGCTLHEVKFEFQALWILTAFYFLTACLLYRYEFIKMISRIVSLRKRIIQRRIALRHRIRHRVR